jgi:hypothetical protein
LSASAVGSGFGCGAGEGRGDVQPTLPATSAAFAAAVRLTVLAVQALPDGPARDAVASMAVLATGGALCLATDYQFSQLRVLSEPAPGRMSSLEGSEFLGLPVNRG